jgi:hypothetical protein
MRAKIKTDFSLQNFKNHLMKPSRYLLSLLFVIPLIGLTSSPSVRADDVESIRLSQATLSSTNDNTWLIDAEVQVSLSSVLVDAVKRGVPLQFVSEFEVLKKRWYWFDAKVLAKTKSVRINYHALTQQYRVSIGGLHQMAYPDLGEALVAAVNLRGWPVVGSAEAPASAVLQEAKKSPKSFDIRLRVRLDSAQLPKPLQINALTNQDWNLSSDWIAPQLASDLTGAAP